MNIIEQVENYVKERSEEYKNNSPDNYDFWNQHIKYVYDESIKLAKEYNADLEIVSIGALLHDIALINKVGDRKDHHINGEKISKEVLERFNYDKTKMNRVLKCVYNHRSSKNANTVEETCVADADILAHFDNIPLVFDFALVRNKISLNNVKDWLKDYLEKDYNDLSDKTKEKYKDKYKTICEILLNEKE